MIQLDKKKVKSYFLLSGLIIFFIIFIIKLYSLQVTHKNFFSKQAFNNKKQIVKIPTLRGRIYLEDGTVLADNRLSYAIYMIPYNFPRNTINPKEFNRLVNVLTNRLSIPYRNLERVFKKAHLNPYTPYLLKKNVSVEDIHYLAENIDDFSGIIYQEIFDRVYPQGNPYAHITGYVQNISARELRKRKGQGYDPESIIGKIGVESYYDQELRGKKGYKINIVDVKNRIKEEIFPENGVPLPGKDIFLSIDPRIQNIIYQVLKGFKGGVIVTRPTTGEILGLYSFPSYDPNIFTGTINREVINAYFRDEDSPFLNRVIQTKYPPGSIFKLIMALTALDDPAFNYRTRKYFCSGGLYIGNNYFKCEGIHRDQVLLTAIPNSCNVYFYRLGLEMGPNVISKYSQDYFNLGINTGVDLAYEKNGLIPSPKWKIENLGSFWWDGDTVNLSIGQGYFSSTIIQVNLITSAIANNGIGYRPHILKKYRSMVDNSEIVNPQSIVIRMPFSQDKIRLVQRAMRNVVRWGTARRINNDKIKIAGKTGTSQTYDDLEAHSWFSGYAPYDAPPEERLVVTVLIEHGGYGSIYSAIFVEAIFQAIFAKRDPNLVVKERLQFFNANKFKYQDWLKIKKEKKLPEDYFENNL